MYYHFLKKSRQVNPSQVLQRGPYGERYPLTGIFTSLLIYLLSLPRSYRYGSPFHVPLQAPHGQGYSAEPLVHSFMTAGVHKRALLHMGKNIRLPSTEPHAADTAVSTPVPRSPRHDTFHFGLGRPEPRQPICVITPITVYPPKLTASHMTQGRVEYESKIPQGTVVGLDL
jgi:hypothetical protein